MSKYTYKEIARGHAFYFIYLEGKFTTITVSVKENFLLSFLIIFYDKNERKVVLLQ